MIWFLDFDGNLYNLSFQLINDREPPFLLCWLIRGTCMASSPPVTVWIKARCMWHDVACEHPCVVEYDMVHSYSFLRWVQYIFVEHKLTIAHSCPHAAEQSVCWSTQWVYVRRFLSEAFFSLQTWRKLWAATSSESAAWQCVKLFKDVKRI